MEKTININLGGSLFQIDEEAFILLRDYLQAINNRFRNVPGGPETIEDIESRIAEIFRSQKGLAGVITKQNVEAMISTIGKPEDFDAGISSGSPSEEKKANKRLYRNPDDKVIGGVCGGLGTYLNADPVIFRILFVLFTLFGGAGILIYLVFWVVVPSANNDMAKREMYGSSYYTYRNPDGSISSVRKSSSVNTGLNEVISAFGKVFFIIFRIFLIVIGTCLVLTGFLFILSFVMIFILKIPGAFTHHGIDFSITYLPDLLGFIFSPASAPWIWALLIFVFILPMVALIYWGVRMIFWFKVRDGAFNLAMLIVWIVSLAALSIMIFNEGVSFAESSSSTSKNILQNPPDTLYIVSGRKIDDIAFDSEFSTPDNEYSLFMADSTKDLYIKPGIRFGYSDNDVELEIIKKASGRNRRQAAENAESLSYNYQMKGDSIILDEYFKIPSGKKWTADFINIRISLPPNTVFYIDNECAGLLGNKIHVEKQNGDNYSSWEYSDIDPVDIGGRYWIFTDDGLKEAAKNLKSK